jgi:large subunit ribosomal protein L4
MPAVTYSKTGTKATTSAKLDKSVFELEVTNFELLKQAVTKTRGLVRGGGKKPWAQKGTGRARFGSSRVPIWRGGGITFGPTGLENYSKSINTKSKRQAIRQALSIANQDKKIIVIEDVLAKNGKTAELSKLLSKIGVTRKVLIVVDNKTEELTRASRNLQGVILSSSLYLNVFDILNADHIVFSEAGLKASSEWLNKESK